MKIITKVSTIIFNISKKEFLSLKVRFQNMTTKPAMQMVEEFLKYNTKLSKKEITGLAKFFLTSDFRIEQ